MIARDIQDWVGQENTGQHQAKADGCGRLDRSRVWVRAARDAAAEARTGGRRRGQGRGGRWSSVQRARFEHGALPSRGTCRAPRRPGSGRRPPAGPRAREWVGGQALRRAPPSGGTRHQRAATGLEQLRASVLRRRGRRQRRHGCAALVCAAPRSVGCRGGPAPGPVASQIGTSGMQPWGGWGGAGGSEAGCGMVR